jgi:hypothetical protein
MLAAEAQRSMARGVSATKLPLAMFTGIGKRNFAPGEKAT